MKIKRIKTIIIFSSVIFLSSLNPVQFYAEANTNNHSQIIIAKNDNKKKKSKKRTWKKKANKSFTKKSSKSNINNQQRVNINPNSLSLSYVSLKKNGTLTWVNTDIKPHTVEISIPVSTIGWLLGRDPKTEKIKIAPGMSFSRKFYYKGTYNYKIMETPGLNGKVRVK